MISTLVLNALVPYVMVGACFYLCILVVAWTLTKEDDDKIQDELREIMEDQRGFRPLVLILTWPWTFLKILAMRRE